jgi:hypothetical protein
LRLRPRHSDDPEIPEGRFPRLIVLPARLRHIGNAERTAGRPMQTVRRTACMGADCPRFAASGKPGLGSPAGTGRHRRWP